MTRADILTIGETMVLFYAEDTTGPSRLGDRLCLDFAGADSNFAIAMSRLGYRAAWISRLGDEPLGTLVLDAIAREGVAGAVALGVDSALTSGTEQPGLEGVSARTRRLKQLVSAGRMEV